MTMRPSDVNDTAEDVLNERVRSVANDPTNAQPLPALVPFATYDLVFRVHEAVARLNNAGRLPWNKQATVARVLASVTGVASQSRQESEYIGNFVDVRLRHYCRDMAKAKAADRKSIQRARTKGLPPPIVARAKILREQLYVCSYGGTPFKIPVVDHEPLPCKRPLPVNKQRVPHKVIGFDEVISDYKRVCHQLVESREKPSHLRTLERDTEEALREVERAKQRYQEAEENAAAAAAIMKLAAHEANEEAVKAREKVKHSELKGKKHEANVLCLQGHLVRAMREAQDEQTKRQRNEDSLREEVARARAEADTCKQRAKEMEILCQKKEGEVVVMEGKLVRACRDAFDEQQKRLKFSRAAESQLEQMTASAETELEIARAEVISIKKARDLCQQEKRKVEQECKVRQADLMRLQSKLGHALQEAASANDKVKQVRAAFDKKAKALQADLNKRTSELQRARELKNRMARRLREVNGREENAENEVTELHKCRQRVRALNKEVNALRSQVCNQSDGCNSSEEDERRSESDSDFEEQDAEEVATKAAASEALERMQSMPEWRAVRGKGAGKGAAKIEWRVRLVIYAFLALMVPASAVGMAIVMVVKLTAPWLRPTAPTYETVERCRFELRFLEEAVSARRLANSFKVRMLGFDETTKFGLASLTTSVTIEPTPGAELEDVILRAAYCPQGATAELCVQSIERRCCSRLRDMLRRWEAQFHKMYPNERWTGPDPNECSLRRLGGGGAIMSDTCNTARCAKRLLAELVAKEVEAHHGLQRWASMSDDEREACVRTHQIDCWGHMRNIFLEHMSVELAKHVKAELQPELETFSAWERMTTEYSQLVRACYKEFHHGCRYYKGKGRPYAAWLRETYPTAFVMHLERADGSRQDLDFDAAIPLYIDRPFFVEYLSRVVFGPDHSNILEDFLFVTLRSMQFIAMTRANAIVDLLVSRPLRWLAGKSSQLSGWSPYSMGEALDLVEQFFENAQHDGSLFFNQSSNLFQPIADKQPLFATWLKDTFEKDHILAPDGRTKHLRFKLVQDELLHPSDPTNIATRLKTIEYLEVQCRAALNKMHDPKLALRAKLSSCDGAHSVGKQAQAHEDTLRLASTNDTLAESVFGTYDMILRRCPGISMEAASAVAQAVRSKVLSLGDFVARRKQSTKQPRKDYMGYVYSLPEHEQEALVEAGRLSVKELRSIDHAEHAALDEYHKERRKVNERDELDALFSQYALALSFFKRWQERGVESGRDVAEAMAGFSPTGPSDSEHETRDCEQRKLDWLREQIEMRTIGLSWTEYRTKWQSSKSDDIGTVDQLTSHLEEILQEEAAQRRTGSLPSKFGKPEDVCPAPQLKRKTFKALGTPTVQAASLSDSRIDITPEELLEKTLQRKRQLELDGVIDVVCDTQPHAPGKGPPIDGSFVGKKLEVRWKYFHQTSGKPLFMWCEGEVVQVADGKTDKKSARCKKILPAGAVRIKWPADVEFDEEPSFSWSILNPNNFNREVQLGWRYAASELQRVSLSKKRAGPG